MGTARDALTLGRALESEHALLALEHRDNAKLLAVLGEGIDGGEAGCTDDIEFIASLGADSDRNMKHRP